MHTAFARRGDAQYYARIKRDSVLRQSLLIRRYSIRVIGIIHYVDADCDLAMPEPDQVFNCFTTGLMRIAIDITHVRIFETIRDDD